MCWELMIVRDLGADVNDRDMWGGTPISAAAAHGHLDVLNELLTQGELKYLGGIYQF